MSSQIQFKRATAEKWNAINPVLAQGEPALTLSASGEVIGMKIGDGVNSWTNLKYIGTSNTSSEQIGTIDGENNVNLIVGTDITPITFTLQGLCKGNSELIYYYGEHTFQYMNEALTWENANTKCQNLGGHLATSTSAEKNKFLSSMGYPIHLGAKRNDETNDFEWVTGEKWDYQIWATGEPNNVNERYLQMHKGGTWNDYTDPLAYVCEWDDIRIPIAYEVWSVNSLPDGLWFDANNHTISGTPTTAGIFNVKVSVFTNAGSVSKDLIITITEA